MQTQIHTREDWLTLDEVARQYKLTKSWLYEQTRTGAIPIHRFGRQIRIDALEFAEWARERR